MIDKIKRLLGRFVRVGSIANYNLQFIRYLLAFGDAARAGALFVRLPRRRYNQMNTPSTTSSTNMMAMQIPAIAPLVRDLLSPLGPRHRPLLHVHDDTPQLWQVIPS